MPRFLHNLYKEPSFASIHSCFHSTQLVLPYKEMEYAQNQDEQKAVEPIVEVAISKLLEIEIDSQILSAFMEVDPVFNPADVDDDVEHYLYQQKNIHIPDNLGSLKLVGSVYIL
ncbi:hypothetical protein Tco_0495694 [Tanacetum coccineum]